jgi:hypothetical protein
MNAKVPEISANIELLRERIERAASRCGRRAEEITLVAASKTVSAERIRAAYEAGIRHFGENRVQERESKSAQLADLGITWHLIGSLQSNKAARAVRLFSSVDSLDRIAMAERLERAVAGDDASAQGVAGKRLRVLIEVKLDPEPAKSGVSEADLPPLVEAALRQPHLDVHGLMGVPPFLDDLESVRPYFRHLRELRDAFRARLGSDALPVLSMGMSHDFEMAIEEGATEVRIGTDLFGERRKP